MADTVLLHLSDLHLDTEHDWALLNDISTAIAPVPPRVIIISGDFVNGPDKARMERVHKRVEELAKKFTPCDLVVVPGNHDYREWGVFRRSAAGTEFETVFGKEWRNARFVPMNKGGIAFFCFDSNTNDPRVNFARGRVGRNEYRRFRDEYRRMQQAHGKDFSEAFKIAVLHHHPMPIADSELAVERGVIAAIKDYWTGDAFLGLQDAGLFVREMVTKRIDLVLHGHKHFPFSARVEVETADEKTGEIQILAAGSASKAVEGGGHKNSFNLIILRDDGTVEIQLWDNSTGSFYYRPGARKKPWVINYERARERVFENFCAESEFMVARESHSTVINKYGDCERLVVREEMRATGTKPIPTIPIETSSAAAIYAGLSIKATSKHADPVFEPTADCKRGELRGQIRFERPLDSDPLSFQTRYRAFNAFAFTQEQRYRMQDEQGPEYQRAKIRYPIGNLSLSIKFPPNVPVPRPTVHVYFEEGKARDSLEERWCEHYLQINELLRTATLSVPKPLQKHRYSLAWMLPSEKDQLEASPYSIEDESLAQFIQTELTRQPPGAALDTVQARLEEAHATIVAKYESADEREHIELGLMVFDEKINRLRFVAGVIRPEFREYKLRDGEGVGGRSHKLNQSLLVVRGRQKEGDFTATPPPGVEPPEFLLCVPLLYPFGCEDGWAVGVLALSSDSLATKLLTLYAETDALPANRDRAAKDLKAQRDLKRLVEFLSEKCLADILASLAIKFSPLTDENGRPKLYSL